MVGASGYPQRHRYIGELRAQTAAFCAEHGAAHTRVLLACCAPAHAYAMRWCAPVGPAFAQLCLAVLGCSEAFELELQEMVHEDMHARNTWSRVFPSQTMHARLAPSAHYIA